MLSGLTSTAIAADQPSFVFLLVDELR